MSEPMSGAGPRRGGGMTLPVLGAASAIFLATGAAAPLAFVFGWIAHEIWARRGDWLGSKIGGK
jgi:hypothetical protein